MNTTFYCTPKDSDLIHYGVKGMKWGVRKTDREARKDAKEFARAKMYYGEGAGTRRKLIKARVEQRTKDHPGYKEAFDKHLASQDMSKHASRAKAERKVRTGVKTTARTTRGVVNSALRNGARVSASAASIYAVAHYMGYDEKIISWGKRKMADIKYDQYVRAARNIKL